jgi:hypothetical protein
MKKITLLFCLTLLTFFARAQGLDSIHVEFYYVADTADASGSVGVLPVGSVTYRLWAYMQPGYKLQAVYGVPGHDFLLTSSTTFFNNEDYGSTVPTGISLNNTRKNSVMLDSWFSMGGNAVGKVAVPKPADTDGALVNTAIPPILQNNNPWAGIPINTQDGMIAGSPPSVTVVGIGTTGPKDLYVFDNLSQVGDTFETSNGSIAVLGGVMGPDSANNRVLIGQFTTDGTFCYKLHAQIGTPTSGVENYVADSAVGNEIVLPTLHGCFQYPTGIPVQQNISASGSFSVYPNPANDFVTISFNQSSSKAAYTLFDLEGRIIYHKDLGSVAQKSSERVSISSLASAIYFLELNADGISSRKKIIKN